VPEQSGVPRAVRLAGLLAVVEGAGVLLAAAALGVATALEPPESYGRALLRIGLGIARVERWARAPVVVAQVLLVPVGYTLAVTAQLPLYGVPILALVAAEVCLLLTPEARLAFLDR
jgi:hypothetical protein